MAIAAIGFVLLVTSVVVVYSLDAATDRDLEHHASAARALLQREATYLQIEAHMLANLDGHDALMSQGDAAQLYTVLAPVVALQGLDGLAVYAPDGSELVTIGQIRDEPAGHAAATHQHTPTAVPVGLTLVDGSIALTGLAEHKGSNGRVDGVFATYRKIDRLYLEKMKENLGPDFTLMHDGSVASSLPLGRLQSVLATGLLDAHQLTQQSQFATIAAAGGRNRLFATHLEIPGTPGLCIGVMQRAAVSNAVVPQTISHIIVLGVLLIAVTLSLVHFLVLHVFNPLRRLQHSAELIAGGELDRPVAVSGVVEVDALSSAFERMRRQLQESFHGQQRWNAELEREVQVRTSELESICRQRDTLLAKLIFAQEDEQRRIARELHDDTSQALVHLSMMLGETAQNTNDLHARTQLCELKQRSSEALDSIKRIIMDLRPRLLDEYGLFAAVRWYAQDRLAPAGVSVAVDERGSPAVLPPHLETGLFRVVQEAINNIARHSAATTATIRLLWETDAVTIEVCDNGQGFEPARVRSDPAKARSVGLIGMRERIEMVQGTLRIESQPGAGAGILVRVPVGQSKGNMNGEDEDSSRR